MGDPCIRTVGWVLKLDILNEPVEVHGSAEALARLEQLVLGAGGALMWYRSPAGGLVSLRGNQADLELFADLITPVVGGLAPTEDSDG